MSWDRVLTECSIGTAVWFLLINVERSKNSNSHNHPQKEYS
ncbi:hypothetical protein ACQCVM_07705 [Rossellomorea aquimaris]